MKKMSSFIFTAFILLSCTENSQKTKSMIFAVLHFRLLKAGASWSRMRMIAMLELLSQKIMILFFMITDLIQILLSSFQLLLSAEKI